MAVIASPSTASRPFVHHGILRCPTTGLPLRRLDDGSLVSADDRFVYPVLDGVPILLNERRSTFRIEDYTRQQGFSPTLSRAGRAFDWLDRHLPSLTVNLGSEENFRLLEALVRDQVAADGRLPRVLVVGGGSGGAGSAPVLQSDAIDCVETDVAMGERTQIVCDAHDLPFADGAVSAVVCQAVLEHVLDPVRVVEEIHRVLEPGGLVYSEVPFMQQVHGGAYDVTRFSQLGHRRLYRHFDEVRSGIQGGPGMALGWAVWYLLRAPARTRTGRGLAFLLARLSCFWLKYLDRWLSRYPGAVDGASGTFFLGRRRDDAISDEAILAGYRGAGSLRPATQEA